MGDRHADTSELEKAIAFTGYQTERIELHKYLTEFF
jgi:hypothetical protein